MMRSNQINFFFMPEDVFEIDNYARMNDIIIVSQPMPSDNLRTVESISTFESDLDKKMNKKFLIRNIDKSKVSVRYIKEQNYYLINDLNSPCIEILYSAFIKSKDKALNRGRFYYSKNFYDGKLLRNKDEAFIQFASEFFKWIRKYFKNVKLKGLEDFLVSERTLEWIKSGGTLLENYNLSSRYAEENKIVQEKAIA